MCHDLADQPETLGLDRVNPIIAVDQVIGAQGTQPLRQAGGDMNAVQNPDRRWDAFTESYDGTPFETLGKIPKLVVCAVNGIAMGGGLVMTLFADLVVASDRARFRVPDLTRGVYEAFVAARLPQRLGTLRANHLIYGNDWVDA
ncbi:enoyl-CoA hydratase/isomerase family protein, partial [Mycobacterium alsense]|uniref:enoyl-CoA hydratase/isomerase family protein n=1 Tax=Mycobacterium alsense TaxID=324058 RepID=UPI001F0A2684